MRHLALWVVGLLVAALAVYEVKYEVRNIKQDVTGLERSISEERETIHVLEAEWALLTHPARLQTLAERHLQLAPVAPQQIQDESALVLPDPQAPAPSLAAAEGGKRE